MEFSKTTPVEDLWPRNSRRKSLTSYLRYVLRDFSHIFEFSRPYQYAFVKTGYLMENFLVLEAFWLMYVTEVDFG